jgi:hypothetical protein
VQADYTPADDTLMELSGDAMIEHTPDTPHA